MPHIYTGSSLTGLGVLLGIGVMTVFVLLNWLGVQLFARINGALTVAKFVVPTLTVIALFISGFAFVLASMILYWATWKELRIALPVLLGGAVVYGIQQYRGGANWIPARWDSVIAAVIGVIGYEWGVRNAVKYLAVHPAPEPAHTDPDADDALDDFGAAPAG